MKKMRRGGGIANRELPQIYNQLVEELDSDAGFLILTSHCTVRPPIPTPFSSDLRILNSGSKPSFFLSASLEGTPSPDMSLLHSCWLLPPRELKWVLLLGTWPCSSILFNAQLLKKPSLKLSSPTSRAIHILDIRKILIWLLCWTHSFVCSLKYH